VESHTLGAVLVVAGIVLLLAGVLAWSGALRWFGHLPGDIRVERTTVRFYFPLVSMLLVSVVLSLLARLARRLF